MRIPKTKKLLFVTACAFLFFATLANFTKSSTTIEAKTIMLDATSRATVEPADNTATPLAIKVLSTTKVKLSWTQDMSMTGYKIYRSTSKTKGYKKIATVKCEATSYTDKSLSKNKTYYYKIRTYTGNEYSAYSNIVKKAKVKK